MNLHISDLQKHQLKKLLQLPSYTKDIETNCLKANTVEIKIVQFLKDCGFEQYYNKNNQYFKKAELQGFVVDNRYANEKFFIHQPFGTQNSPDFLICVYGLIVCLEDKSSKNGTIMWNSHIPRNDFLYHFCIPGYSTICFNPIEISSATSETLSSYIAHSKEFAKETNTQLKSSTAGISLTVYPRFMLEGTSLKNKNNLRVIQNRSNELQEFLNG